MNPTRTYVSSQSPLAQFREFRNDLLCCGSSHTVKSSFNLYETLGVPRYLNSVESKPVMTLTE